jgi:hypothetical protein
MRDGIASRLKRRRSRDPSARSAVSSKPQRD